MISEMYYTTNDALGKGETRLIINEAIFKHSEKLLLFWVEKYKRNPKSVINEFFKYNSVRMSICLIIFWARKKGVLKELEGKKDFKEWVSKQNLEDRWKPVLSNFLLILYGLINE